MQTGGLFAECQTVSPQTGTAHGINCHSGGLGVIYSDEILGCTQSRRFVSTPQHQAPCIFVVINQQHAGNPCLKCRLPLSSAAFLHPRASSLRPSIRIPAFCSSAPFLAFSSSTSDGMLTTIRYSTSSCMNRSRGCSLSPCARRSVSRFCAFSHWRCTAPSSTCRP